VKTTTKRRGLYSVKRVRASGIEIATVLVKMFGMPAAGKPVNLQKDFRAIASDALKCIREFAGPIAKAKSNNTEFARDALETISEIESLGVLRHRLASRILLLGMDLATSEQAMKSNINWLGAVESRRKSDVGQLRASRANRKLTRTAYQAACKNARTRKELALIVGMSRQGLANWEARNQVSPWKLPSKRQQRT
jgi:DNA-binding XRE family transcriptional regulator